MDKERLDVLLVSRKLADSREKAKSIIMSGNVYVNGQKEDKAGTTFPVDCEIDVKVKKLPYVSRGGFKLEKGLKVFHHNLDSKICMDIGASTGGFTDCMLKNGAQKVYSVDVGTGQLAWELRNDDRVVCMEKFNVRYITPEDIEDTLDFASVDVSFISLTKILAPVKKLLKPDARMICLIKPQFEAGREKVGKKGVVKDIDVHEDVIRKVCSYAKDIGFEPIGLSFSPIRGPEGNIEYLVYLKQDPDFDDSKETVEAGNEYEFDFSIEDITREAHKEL